MSINYYNEQTRRNGRINEIRLNGRTAYIANYQDEHGVCCSKIRETMKAANRDMEEHGYHKKGIIDESGCARHTMSRAELEHLYKEIERFVADSMPDECRENEQAIKGIETMIHQRMRTADVTGILKV